MRYPFYRVISFLSTVVIAALAWLWLYQPAPPASQIAGVASEYRFEVEALKPHPTVLPDATDATKRPLFTPGRKPFVPAPPPSPILIPPPISVVEDPPKEIPLAPALPIVPVTPAPALETPVQTPLPVPPRFEDAGLQVKGIMINSTEKRALMKSLQHPAGLWLRSGETMEGWDIIAIEKNRVILKAGKFFAVLQLYLD
jgi:hypothetical protein